jgi:hypothetical protein
MTDRIHSLTVDIRIDDAAPLIETIKLLPGVIDVKGCDLRARRQIHDQLTSLIKARFFGREGELTWV